MTFEEIKQALKYRKVGIAGCGGLGSNCAVALARVGVGNLIVADFDVIVESNLNRQYYFYSQMGLKKVYALQENLKSINPFVKVDGYDLKITPIDVVRLFGGCDVIVEAFDEASEKQMLIETVLQELPETPLVCGVGMAGWGNFGTLKENQIDKLYLCGDGLTEVSENMPPLAPRVAIVANMQANKVLEILLGK